MSESKCLQCNKDASRGIIGTVKVVGDVLSIKDIDYRPLGDYSTELTLDGDFCSSRCLKKYIKDLFEQAKSKNLQPGRLM